MLVNPEDNEDVAKDINEHFIKTCEIEFFKKGMIAKAYKKGYKNIIDLVAMKENDFLKIEGVKEKSAKKIFKSFSEKLNLIAIWKLAAASSYFDNLGRKRLKLIFDKIPNVLEIKNKKEIKSQITNIDGFSEITSDNFINDIKEFKIFIKTFEKYYKIKYIDDNLDSKKGVLNDKKFLFTGKIDKDLKNKIIENSGEVLKTFSKKLDYLIAFDKDSGSDKIKKAIKNNIPVLSHKELKNLLKNKFKIK